METAMAFSPEPPTGLMAPESGPKSLYQELFYFPDRDKKVR